MPQMTQRQWEEYQAIIKKCRQMELESRSAKALQAQIDKLTERERSMTESHTQLVTYLNMQVATLTDDLDRVTDRADAATEMVKASAAALEDQGRLKAELTAQVTELETKYAEQTSTWKASSENLFEQIRDLTHKNAALKAQADEYRYALVDISDHAATGELKFSDLHEQTRATILELQAHDGNES